MKCKSQAHMHTLKSKCCHHKHKSGIPCLHHAKLDLVNLESYDQNPVHIDSHIKKTRKIVLKRRQLSQANKYLIL